MDEIVARQLTRQLKLLNFWITLFGTLFLIGFIIVSVLLYKVITFTYHVSDSVGNLEQKTSQTLNVQKQVCDTKSIGSVLQDKTSVCK